MNIIIKREIPPLLYAYFWRVLSLHTTMYFLYTFQRIFLPHFMYFLSTVYCPVWLYITLDKASFLKDLTLIYNQTAIMQTYKGLHIPILREICIISPRFCVFYFHSSVFSIHTSGIFYPQFSVINRIIIRFSKTVSKRCSEQYNRFNPQIRPNSQNHAVYWLRSKRRLKKAFLLYFLSTVHAFSFHKSRIFFPHFICTNRITIPFILISNADIYFPKTLKRQLTNYLFLTFSTHFQQSLNFIK